MAMPRQGRTPQNDVEPCPCVVCGKEFQPYRDYQTACSRSCREEARRRGFASPRATRRHLACRGCGRRFIATWSGIGSPPHCPSCTADLTRASQERKNVARRVSANPGRRDINLRDLLRRRYGITPEQYRTMLAVQDGGCAICDDPPDPNGVKASSRLHVDHDHVTGSNRDLLCNRCNRGIGYFRDDPGLLRSAAEYIERHRV